MEKLRGEGIFIQGKDVENGEARSFLWNQNVSSYDIYAKDHIHLG